MTMARGSEDASAHGRRNRHDRAVPSGLDGNPNPLTSPQRGEVLATLADEIHRRTSAERVFKVAVDGMDGAGKSTFADELGDLLRERGRAVIRSTTDSFHNARAIRRAKGVFSPVGFYEDSHNLRVLKQRLLDPLSKEPPEPYRVAAFDEPSDSPVEPPLEEAPPGAILVFDGLFLQRPELAAYWDFLIYLGGERRVSDQRIRAASDGCPPGGAGLLHLARWWALLERYVGGIRLYVEACRPQDRADALVDNNDFLHPTLVWRAER